VFSICRTAELAELAELANLQNSKEVSNFLEQVG
jgi:hypothetical protein